MKLIRSPKRGLCVTAAFAMAMDVDVNYLIEKVGHDGQGLLPPPFNDLEEPHCLRGHHVQELIDVALGLGWAPIEIEAMWAGMIGMPSGKQEIVPLSDPEYMHERFRRWLGATKRGVIFGTSYPLVGEPTPHAVAWDGENCHDPAGLVYDIDSAPEHRFNDISSLLAFFPIKIN